MATIILNIPQPNSDPLEAMPMTWTREGVSNIRYYRDSGGEFVKFTTGEGKEVRTNCLYVVEEE